MLRYSLCRDVIKNQWFSNSSRSRGLLYSMQKGSSTVEYNASALRCSEVTKITVPCLLKMRESLEQVRDPLEGRG